MITSQRVIFSDNGTLTDISKFVNNYKSDTYTLPYVAGEDYIYVGSDLPFNHKYLDISTANDQAASVSVDIWWDDAWVAAVDIIDRTDSSGTTLASSDIIQWSTEINEGWRKEQESEDVTGLSGTNIYNFYWLRLSFSADLNASTALNYIGNLFANQDDLYSYYPDFNDSNMLTGYESGKSSWKEQLISASELVITDLKRRQIIKSRNQVLDWELFREPAMHQCAMIIYRAMGQGFNENFMIAKEAYDKAINIKNFNVDLDRNARLTWGEKNFSTGFFTR